MASATFDTLKAKETLTHAKAEEKEAEAIIDIIREAVSENVAADKEDIARLERRLFVGLAVASGLIIATAVFIFGD